MLISADDDLAGLGFACWAHWVFCRSGHHFSVLVGGLVRMAIRRGPAGVISSAVRRWRVGWAWERRTVKRIRSPLPMPM
jgi:hypothetical protein